MHEDEVFVGDAIAAGARAYVLKSESGARLVDAVDALSRHEPFFSPRVAGLVLSALVRARDPAAGSYAEPLTHREREVAQLLVEGLGSRAVASRLGITSKTVDTHRAAIMRKLGMSSMADLGALRDPAPAGGALTRRGGRIVLGLSMERCGRAS